MCICWNEEQVYMVLVLGNGHCSRWRKRKDIIITESPCTSLTMEAVFGFCNLITLKGCGIVLGVSVYLLPSPTGLQHKISCSTACNMISKLDFNFMVQYIYVKTERQVWE